MDCSLMCPQCTEYTARVQTGAVDYWGSPICPASMGGVQEGHCAWSCLLCSARACKQHGCSMFGMYSTSHQPYKSRTVLQPGLSHCSNLTEEHPGITDSYPKSSISTPPSKKKCVCLCVSVCARCEHLTCEYTQRWILWWVHRIPSFFR